MGRTLLQIEFERKLRKQLDNFTNNIQRKFDDMDENDFNKKENFHWEITSIQTTADDLINEIDSCLDNS